MPRPNRPRSIASEDNLARRITYERERPDRRWSYAGLARRMTEAGCAIDQSALYKIEKGTPRRHIQVDELVALSEVFAVPVHELLLPPELHAERHVLDVLERYRQAKATLTAAKNDLYDLLKGDQHVRAALEEHLTWSDVPPIAPQSEWPEWTKKRLDGQLAVDMLDAMIARHEKAGRADLAAGVAQLRYELTREKPTDG